MTNVPSVFGRFFEDVKVGDRFGSESYETTETAIQKFAREFDPQSFHLDSALAEQSVFRGLCASGWHTAAIAMRLFITGELRFAGGAIGLGVDELRWPNPLRPGDCVRLETEIREVRVSKSKPTHGVVRLRNVLKNQRGEIVLSYLASAMVRRRVAKNQT